MAEMMLFTPTKVGLARRIVAARMRRAVMPPPAHPLVQCLVNRHTLAELDRIHETTCRVNDQTHASTEAEQRGIA